MISGLWFANQFLAAAKSGAADLLKDEAK